MRTFATIELEDGRKIRCELFPEYAPITCENFVKLANENFYNGLIFHRVIDRFMIQGGGMTPALEAKYTPSIKGEFRSNGVKNPVKHTLGTLSMARTNVPDSASSQFFICVNKCDFLDGEYAAFGRVVDDESMKVAIAISKVATTSKVIQTKLGYPARYDDVPVRDIVIKRVYIQTFEE
ncbi:MAG: peptidylprolyl isomerase [Clostridia bacterium]|nr:peptidylprolyl isomerase [Clostridia bacterium]